MIYTFKKLFCLYLFERLSRMHTQFCNALIQSLNGFNNQTEPGAWNLTCSDPSA